MPTYGLPWSTKAPMFPSTSKPLGSARNPDKRLVRPVLLQSQFGPQVDSRKSNLSKGGRMAPPGSARLHIASVPTATSFVSPSPLHYQLVPSCGVQPLSNYSTAARTPLNLKEDRWRPAERVQRANATPAPSAYYPK